MNARPHGVVRLPAVESVEQAFRPALVGPRSVTYGELVKTVGRVAAGLRGLGATVGDRVVIWMDKGPEYAHAILAALHAGCAYVPLDGGHPAQRVRTIIEDTEPIVVFTDARHLPLLTDAALPHSVKAVVAVSDSAPRPALTWTEFLGIADRSERTPGPVELTPDDLAAILYTSGSTGTPKGVQISHRNLAAFIDWARGELDLGADDVFANHASFNFDLSTFDLFVALSAGAAVWIVEDEQARDAAALAAGIRDYGVTVWYSVPSILALLTGCGALTAEVARGLRYVLFAGEVYPKPRLKELLVVLEDATRVYNLYGPTETNVCTYHRLTPADQESDDPLPIGLPVDSATALIVDADGQTLTGPEAFGELVIEGDCVTPGYWRREAEPAAAHHRRRRHPTGDLVGWVHGRLVYHGRKDRMVKASGYRIELGEIESVALRHPALEEAAVLVTGEGPDAKLTLFYTVRAGADAPALLDLKRHCAQFLPRYMVPRNATRVPALPRNTNGKIDYRSLAGRNRP
ncbi:amino acid adenylation domain-containing protein [Nocardia sp. NPDC051832]|uniref:amino acid adenylation domain-containing protein n=1 Tax=Nocardia sp. NPDC051832 TaxID=3155673 RepID=UPI003433CE68